jgi:hypothetical protein
MWAFYMVVIFRRLLAFTVLIYVIRSGLHERFERSKLLKMPHKPSRTIRSFDLLVEHCFMSRPIEMRNFEDRYSGSRLRRGKKRGD